MKIPVISEEIVKNRQDKSHSLLKIADTCKNLCNKLQDVLTALSRLSDPDLQNEKKIRTDMTGLIQDINNLKDRVEVRYNRFNKGLITISIAGLEKAGKTTFLKSLTGIDSLPAFDERCTAVCCEIHYSRERSDFDIEFYTEQEYMERVIKPVVETVFSALSKESDPGNTGLGIPLSASEFMNFQLPDINELAGGTTAYKLLIDLKHLQENFHECRQNLGRAPLNRLPLAELGKWVSHQKASMDEEEDLTAKGRNLARISAVKVCRIYSEFTGGSPHLRWIDTPGVDDPNRRARELTLKTIAGETDLLVVASRPGSSPSPGENFHNFWDSVSRQPDEVSLMNRLLFALNWDKRVDPQGENIKIHQKYLINAGVPQHLFTGPFEAVKQDDAAALMEKVNAHLTDHLTDQDDLVVLEYKSRLKNIQARTRIVHDMLAKNHPSDSGQQDLENEAFHKWFHWYKEGRDTGFWSDLVTALDRATRDILEDKRILESETTLNNIFAKQAKNIQEQIPKPEVLEDYWIRHRGENPVPNGMRTISTYFSTLVNRLASEVQEFGPIMQDKLVQVLYDSGLGPLLSGETAEERIKNLFNSLKGFEKSPVVEVLQETLELPRNLKYVIRYELRAAVDFCDPTLWNKNEDAWNRLNEMVKSNNGEIERLARFDTCKYPPVNDSREKDYEVLKKIAGNALLAIHSALNNERYLPRRIADDFMRDCRVRLCFSPESEQEWRTLLFKTRGQLLSGTIGKIRAESEKVQAFRTALNNLDAQLP
ncbi:Dynamin domain-containing protein [Desulfonema limicola]|uniref:Dynamin domain-containing protein n=1 Tax=Desulfonema limicola TaxID=45656 RepID=A0A975GEL3_9BACT|nr:dynamin family protein [Desulfonema limicola]QTA78342.1 Dynamin domain-containing protein [Desulfonema limicola]